MKKRIFTFLFYNFILSFGLAAQSPCVGDLQVLVQGTSNGLAEGLIVKNPANDGTNSLRNIIQCAKDGDVITFDQEGQLPINTSNIIQQLNIDKSLTIMGLSITSRPQIIVDFSSLGMNSGVVIMNDKTLVFLNVDLKETNNPSQKEIIKVEDGSMLKIMGKTVVTKN
jgi:hypothetical protein